MVCIAEHVLLVAIGDTTCVFIYGSTHTTVHPRCTTYVVFPSMYVCISTGCISTVHMLEIHHVCVYVCVQTLLYTHIYTHVVFPSIHVCISTGCISIVHMLEIHHVCVYVGVQ